MGPTPTPTTAAQDTFDLEPSDGVDGQLRAVGLAFVRIAAARRRDNPSLECEDGSFLPAAHLTDRHVIVVGYLAHDGALTVGELAERLGVTMTTASLLATDLEEAQLVVRRRDPADRRRVQLQLTEAHARVVQRLIARRTQPLRRTLQRLDASERNAFVKALGMFADELERQAD